MYVYLSKILPLFVMPLSVVLLLSLVALILLRRGRTNISAGLVLMAIGVLWIASTPVVAKLLYSGIESNYPALPLDEIPESGCLIVLGGVVGAPLPPRVEIEMHDSIDRIYKTVELYHAGKAPIVIVTGGNQPWSDSSWAEADLIRGMLMKWGVPKDAIFLEGSSRNTRENALFSRNIINAINCEAPLLVTSALHMPRAVAVFDNVGIRVTPVSTDVRALISDSPSVMDFLPSAQALAMTSDAIREWLGQLVYRARGWG